VKTALIAGVTGQDGAYSVLKVAAGVHPDQIYNLAGQTSIGLSFEQPVECMESISTATLDLLEVIRFLGGGIRFFSAGSSECFDDTGQTPATEDMPMRPGSPYAVAKASAYWQVATYREAHSMFACTGILANHESPLRPKRFVTQKIIEGVREIKAGRQSTIQLGNLDIWRDWGWAPDYVDAMALMLQAEQPGDYLIASGSTTSLRQFAQEALAAAGLDLAEQLESVDALKRPADLGWTSSRSFGQIVGKMYGDELF
jgi:GDPmannose 4,6-dehydratase